MTWLLTNPKISWQKLLIILLRLFYLLLWWLLVPRSLTRLMEELCLYWGLFWLVQVWLRMFLWLCDPTILSEQNLLHLTSDHDKGILLATYDPKYARVVFLTWSPKLSCGIRLPFLSGNEAICITLSITQLDYKILVNTKLSINSPNVPSTNKLLILPNIHCGSTLNWATEWPVFWMANKKALGLILKSSCLLSRNLTSTGRPSAN